MHQNSRIQYQKLRDIVVWIPTFITYCKYYSIPGVTNKLDGITYFIATTYKAISHNLVVENA